MTKKENQMDKREKLSDTLKKLQKGHSVLVMDDGVYANAVRRDFPGVAERVLCSNDPDFQQASKGMNIIKGDFLQS